LLRYGDLRVQMIDKPVSLKVELYPENINFLLFFLAFSVNNFIGTVPLLKSRSRTSIYLKAIINILGINGLKEVSLYRVVHLIVGLILLYCIKEGLGLLLMYYFS
jgi:hypothetical protein